MLVSILEVHKIIADRQIDRHTDTETRVSTQQVTLPENAENVGMRSPLVVSVSVP